MYYIKPTVYKQPKCNPVRNTMQFSSVDLCLEKIFISIVHVEKMTCAVAICKQAWITTSSDCSQTFSSLFYCVSLWL